MSQTQLYACAPLHCGSLGAAGGDAPQQSIFLCAALYGKLHRAGGVSVNERSTRALC